MHEGVFAGGNGRITENIYWRARGGNQSLMTQTSYLLVSTVSGRAGLPGL